MKQRTQDLLFAACGVASVVVMFAGLGIGAAGGREFATISSSSAQITKALASPAGAAVWTGAYLELLSFGFFIAFAMWVTAKLGGGVLGSVARAAATSYATLSVASLCLMDAIEYRAGHGIGLQLGTTLITLNEALFVGTWFLAVFFLLAVGPLALGSGRRALGWSAIAVAAITLVTTATSLDNLGQMSNVLWLAWIIAASIALGRGGRRRESVVAIPQQA
ncbi:MAG TPA: hypothetical protein VH108_06080 [Gaiellaceae bacterium]|nr:hypothetical protein [Gaiellaceae bacterium]